MLIRCLKCLKRKDESEFSRSSMRPTGRQAWCKQCKAAYQVENLEEHSARNRAAYEAKKQAVFAHYGTSCQLCKISDPDVLTVDHIDHSGADHRRAEVRGSHGIYAWLVRNEFPPGFRTLCFNCNWKEHLRFKRELQNKEK